MLMAEKIVSTKAHIQTRLWLIVMYYTESVYMSSLIAIVSST